METKRILVVDDDPVVRILMNEFLGACGHHVDTVNSGSECLERLQSETPDLIILDLMMPDMTGLEVLRDIRANKSTANLPVIMLSASTADDDLINPGLVPDRFLEKPFGARAIRAAVDDLLGKDAA